MGRVLELADRPVDETQAAPEDPGGGNRRPYRSLIPLREILGELLETGAASKKVEALYGALVEKAGSELGLLMDMPPADIGGLKSPGLSGELLAAAVERMRAGRVSISPGYDGEYGVIRAFAPGETPAVKSQTELFGDEGAPAVPGLPQARRGAKKTGPAKGPAVKTGPAADNTARPGLVLTPEQEKAAAYEGKQAIIIAGPGTGKTAALAARISRLISGGIDPRSILALSFTVKAAAELGQRIQAAAGTEAAGITAATFHSFCLSLLKDQAGKNGVPENFRITGDGERETLLREILAAARKGAGKKRTGFQKLGEYIEGRKRLLLLPGETAPKFGGPKFGGPQSGGPGFNALIRMAEALGIPEAEPEAERLYGLYRDRLRSSGLLDFDDLVAGTVRLLSGSREQRASCRERFRFIFVDEYQDINFAQYALIRLLTGEAEDLFPPGAVPPGETPSLWVIGDPNQAIYGFRGSDKRFIERFLDDYPGAGTFHLTRSFRCAAPIINAAGRLMDTRLRGTEREVRLFRHEYPTEKSEAEGIARRVSRLIGGASFFAIDSGVTDEGAGETDAADIAVLIRGAALAPPIIKALRDHGIPFEFTGEKPWWEEEPIRTVLDFLREARSSGGACAGAQDLAVKNSAPAEAVKGAWDFLQKSGALTAGKNREAPESLERLLCLAALYENLPALLEDLAIRRAGDAPDIRREGVRIMTIHASKGLEFDVVFIAALEEGLLPFTLYGDQNIEEERRLLYVAMTRARRGLYLSSAGTRNFQGRTLEGRPSRFLAELETLIPLAREPSRPKNPQMSLF
jgi:superfamily I DNA/RNA helicase